MRAVVTDVHRRQRNGELPVEVGVLTADNRDEWAQVRIHVFPALSLYFDVACMIELFNAALHFFTKQTFV